MSVNEILDKIKEIKEFQADTSLAELFGVAPNTVSNWRKRGSIPYDHIVAFCEKERVDLTWLLTGQVLSKIIEVDGEKIQVPAMGEPGLYERAEELRTPEEKRLHAVLIRVRYIYNNGGLEDRARVRGIVEEVYDTLVEKVEKAEKKEASKKGPDWTKF